MPGSSSASSDLSILLQPPFQFAHPFADLGSIPNPQLPGNLLRGQPAQLLNPGWRRDSTQAIIIVAKASPGQGTRLEMLRRLLQLTFQARKPMLTGNSGKGPKLGAQDF